MGDLNLAGPEGFSLWFFKFFKTCLIICKIRALVILIEYRFPLLSKSRVFLRNIP